SRRASCPRARRCRCRRAPGDSRPVSPGRRAQSRPSRGYARTVCKRRGRWRCEQSAVRAVVPRRGLSPSGGPAHSGRRSHGFRSSASTRRGGRSRRAASGPRLNPVRFNGRMSALVEELPDNKVRLTVDVPKADVHHAVEHAASDLAESVKIPGFRKGKVPMPVLVSRIGKERLYSEAIESHIAGWYGNAVARARIRPAENPELDYELPPSDDQDWRFTATVSVLPKPAVADWKQLQVPYAEPEVPEDYVDHELNVLRSTVAELSPVDDRPAQQGDTVVIDLVTADGGGQRDYV